MYVTCSIKCNVSNTYILETTMSWRLSMSAALFVGIVRPWLVGEAALAGGRDGIFAGNYFGKKIALQGNHLGVAWRNMSWY